MTLADNYVIKTKLHQPVIHAFSLLILQLCAGVQFVKLFQTSPESPGIYLLLHKLFRSQSIEELQSAAEAQGVTKDEFHVSHDASAPYCSCKHVHNLDFLH